MNILRSYHWKMQSNYRKFRLLTFNQQILKYVNHIMRNIHFVTEINYMHYA